MASQAYADSITPRETVTGISPNQVWTRITSESISDIKVWLVTESRPLPGNPITETKFDKNGDSHSITRTMKSTASITEQQTLIGVTWTSTYAKAISDLVSWEIKDVMLVPGQIDPSSKVDEKYGFVFDIQKQVVPATQTAGIVAGFYTDIKTLDDLRSIRVATKLDPSSLPSDTVYFGGQYHSFPPELLDASYLFAEGFSGCCDSFSITLVSNTRNYSGFVKARYTEQFFSGVPPDNVTIDQFFPRSHTFGFAWASACGGPPATCKSGAPTFRLPPTLHPLTVLVIGAFSTTLAATTPTSLPHNT